MELGGGELGLDIRELGLDIRKLDVDIGNWSYLREERKVSPPRGNNVH